MRAHAREWIPVLVLGLGLALGGCGKTSEKSSSKTKTKTGAVVVKLLTAGSGPRQKLRYRFGAPQTHQVVVTIASQPVGQRPVHVSLTTPPTSPRT